MSDLKADRIIATACDSNYPNCVPGVMGNYYCQNDDNVWREGVFGGVQCSIGYADAVYIEGVIGDAVKRKAKAAGVDVKEKATALIKQMRATAVTRTNESKKKNYLEGRQNSRYGSVDGCSVKRTARD